MNEKELQFRKVLGFNIKVERARKNITQETLAEMAGISTKHVTKIENAGVTPNIYFIYKIAQALDVTIDELTTEYKRSR